MQKILGIIIAFFVAIIISGCVSASFSIGEKEKEHHYYPMPNSYSPGYMTPY